MLTDDPKAFSLMGQNFYSGIHSQPYEPSTTLPRDIAPYLVEMRSGTKLSSFITVILNSQPGRSTCPVPVPHCVRRRTKSVELHQVSRKYDLDGKSDGLPRARHRVKYEYGVLFIMTTQLCIQEKKAARRLGSASDTNRIAPATHPRSTAGRCNTSYYHYLTLNTIGQYAPPPVHVTSPCQDDAERASMMTIPNQRSQRFQRHYSSSGHMQVPAASQWPLVVFGSALSLSPCLGGDHVGSAHDDAAILNSGRLFACFLPT
ncbi:hypothetical protein CIB48_g7571 [Xylaria polymorpha]|nr:hypothetical protein CIB48_g7571 [Xylaria polymorpha]